MANTGDLVAAMQGFCSPSNSRSGGILSCHFILYISYSTTCKLCSSFFFIAVVSYIHVVSSFISVMSIAFLAR